MSFNIATYETRYCRPNKQVGVADYGDDVIATTASRSDDAHVPFHPESYQTLPIDGCCVNTMPPRAPWP